MGASAGRIAMKKRKIRLLIYKGVRIEMENYLATGKVDRS